MNGTLPTATNDHRGHRPSKGVRSQLSSLQGEPGIGTACRREYPTGGQIDP